ncbi:MAG: PQQ-binding-like beta-propeller repeat protein, partial [Phycisphaerales bacterium]|nr:PQQ-binding-like beta-propeller repeat protein [Phycisphaerales bacterium]
QEQLEDARFESARRTLHQLDLHPLINVPAHAADAARPAVRIAAYLDRPESMPSAARWSRLAGGDPPERHRVQNPPDLHGGDRPALARYEHAELTGVVPTPLHAVDLPSASGWAEQANRDTAQHACWVIPAILDNTIFFNDGEAVLALDRFTLRKLWRTPTPAGDSSPANLSNAQRQRNRTRLIEDPSTVTAHDRVVLATLGNVVSGRREGDPRILCLDRATGSVRWAVDPGDLSPDIAGASVRGPIFIADQTAVVSLRKNERSRRIIGVYLAGLDITDGSLRWLRPVGSVGALPYQQQTRAAQAISIHRGVAALNDEIGLTIAVDTDTGRPLWLRRSPGLVDQALQPTAWAVQQAVPDGDAIIAISPDRLSVRRLDAENGRELASRSVRHVGHAVYLLDTPGHPDSIAVVGETRVV